MYIHLRSNQKGFREGRTTVSHILALRCLIEEVGLNNLPAIITFIDFAKAFDTIRRGRKCWQFSEHNGLPKETVDAIGIMYEGTSAKVITPDLETEAFNILASVLQGDTLAPYPFCDCS